MEHVAYENIKAGREYAFVANGKVNVSVCTAKKSGIVAFGTVAVGPTDIYAKRFAEMIQIELPKTEPRKRRGKAVNPASKASRAVEIVRAAKAAGQSRKDIICDLMTTLQISVNCASTYYSNATKKM
jgi:hypothetical protein